MDPIRNRASDDSKILIVIHNEGEIDMKLDELQIDPEFENLIPPLTQIELEGLENNILVTGRILCPIIVWGNTIVDGHNRYKIAIKHPEIPFETVGLEFSDKYEAKAWICDNQIYRRNINSWTRFYLIGEMYIQAKLHSGYNIHHYTKGSNQQENWLGQIGPANSHGMRSVVAARTNEDESYVKRANIYAKAVDAAEKLHPGIKVKFLSGEFDPTIEEYTEMSKASADDLEWMLNELEKPRYLRRSIVKLHLDVKNAEANSPDPKEAASNHDTAEPVRYGTSGPVNIDELLQTRNTESERDIAKAGEKLEQNECVTIQARPPNVNYENHSDTTESVPISQPEPAKDPTAGIIQTIVEVQDKPNDTEQSTRFQAQSEMTKDVLTITGRPIEESVLDSIHSAVVSLMRTCNNLFNRYPTLLTSEQYRQRSIETLEDFNTYIKKIKKGCTKK